MRVVFMGTPDFSVPVLQALVDDGHQIVGVYCQPPRPAGRGKKDRPSPVQIRAQDLGLPVFHPKNFKATADVAQFEALNADVAVVVAYGLLLPPSILQAPAKGCLNIHASLLPRWRGAAPIHRAIMAGDAKTGVCIMQMDAGLDTGDVLTRTETPIDASDTTASLHDRLSELGANLICKVLSDLASFAPVAQAEDGVTYAKKISKSEAQINWQDNAVSVDRHIRGLATFPGAWFEKDGQRVKVLMSIEIDQQGPAGVVLDDELTIGCGTGAVRLITLQRAGKSAMGASDFLRGFPIGRGDSLNA